MTPSLAFDRSLRRRDADGHLIVEMSRISKANICGYRGSEIPGWEALGLNPDRIYKLFRDPRELERAAPTGTGKPLLIRHVPITSDLPNQSLWVGTLGTVTWEAPYLVTRPLTVIAAEAQALIESDEQRELSMGYRYRAEMIPGTHGGEAYDGRMVDIEINHTALVSAGRAGPDVLVADELPLEHLMSLKNSKLIARLQKKVPALATLTTADLMALDAELGETPAKSVVSLSGDEEADCMDAALAEKKKAEGEDAELTDEEKKAAKDKALDKKAKDAKAEDEKDDEEAEDEEAEDEEAEPKKVAKDKKAKDADPDHRKDFNSIKQGKDKAKDKAHDSAMTMDQVNKIVAKAVQREGAKVREEVTAATRALAIAVDEVTPLVGKVQIHAFDSAEEVYAFALEKVGVDIEADFPSAGYRALVKNELRHRDTARKPTKHALDTSGFDADTLFQRVN